LNNNNNIHKEDYKGENNMLRIQGYSRNVLCVKYTKIPITASTTNFVHSKIAGVIDNINFAGVTRRTTYKNNISTGKLVDKTPKEDWAINKAKAQGQNTKNTEQSLLNTQSNNTKEYRKDNSSSSYKGWSAAHVQFYQAKEMKKWILLYNGSTVDLFCNPNLVTNIHTTTKTLEESTNGGCWGKVIS
jgi:hypothetical protein